MSWYRDHVEKPVNDAVDDVIEHPWEAAAVVTAATFGIPAATSVMQAGTSAAASKEALAAADRGAAMELERTNEQIRVMQEENERTTATARARAAASGLSGASAELYVNSLIESGREDIEWLRKVGQSAYNARLEEGQSAFRTAQSNMWGSVGNAATQGIASIDRFKL